MRCINSFRKLVWLTGLLSVAACGGRTKDLWQNGSGGRFYPDNSSCADDAKTKALTASTIPTRLSSYSAEWRTCMNRKGWTENMSSATLADEQKDGSHGAWLRLVGANSDFYFVDTASITRVPNRKIRLNTWWQRLSENRQAIADETTAVTEFDCSSRRVRTSGLVSYHHHGNTVSVNGDPIVSDFVDVTPSTPQSVLMDLVCAQQ